MVWLLSMAAFVGALISGVAGIGGGTLLIAVMFALGLAPVVAIPLHAVVQLGSNASRVVAYVRHVHWPSAALFFVACLPLPFVSASLVARANPDLIRLFLAAAIMLFLWPQASSCLRQSWPLHRKMLLAGFLNGGVGMVIGATGLVIGPLFLHRGWSKETTVGTLALCQCLGHALKILAFGLHGFNIFDQWSLTWPLLLAVALGTLCGRLLMYKLSREQFALLFKVILLLLALRLAYSGLQGLMM